jgi:2,4-dienoyl-CoA reductase-like NADH-dependent reductase (Old Yellow Enzyme family)
MERGAPLGIGGKVHIGTPECPDDAARPGSSQGGPGAGNLPEIQNSGGWIFSFGVGILAVMTQAATSTKDPLLQPFALRHLQLKNRIISTSHEPAYSEDGLPKLRYQLYHEEKAKGGIGMTMIGGSSVVAPDSPPAFGNLLALSDAIIPHFRELARRVHAHDCAVMCQITHLGRRTNWNKADWLPVISASPTREPAHRSFPKEMEDFDIARVVKAYGAGARRCREGGLDGIEIEAYGHLFDAFLSPATNRRSDNYGGSLENRMRFGREVLKEIRSQVGADYIVGIRMVIDEDDLPEGLRFDEGLQIARSFQDEGLIDFVNVIKGHIESDEALSHVIPVMGTPAAPHLDMVKRVKDALRVPVLHAARIADVATARHAIASGAVDLIGMTRAHMADPHIVAKIMRGEEERIRPCVGAGYCIDRIYQGGEALCLHNPATGREETMPHTIAKAAKPKRVVVVGAGPAGLEAARVSASRGHKVTLFEAGQHPGGQVAIAAKAPRRKEIIGIVDWLAAEVEKLDVDFRTGIFAEAGDVQAEDPDIVVIATGGVPNPGFFPGAEDLAATTWDILSGQVAVDENVLLYDDEGGHEALSTAEFAAARAKHLELVTPERVIGVDVGGLNYPGFYKAYYQAQVTQTPNLRLKELRRDGNRIVARFHNDYDKSTVERRVDQVIACHGSLPADGLYFDLKAQSRNRGEIDYAAFIAGKPQGIASNPDGRFQLFRVGDAVASRNIHAAIYDSLRLCMAF